MDYSYYLKRMSVLPNGESEGQEAWEVNSIFMYNMMDYHTLKWPSLTVQWFPGKTTIKETDYYKLLLGTHAEDGENKVILSTINISIHNSANSENSNVGFPLLAKYEENNSFPHSGDVNRARYMPQNTSLIATRSSDTNTYLYGENGLVQTLVGHTDEGYGMSWNPIREGHLLTCSFDNTINLYDVDTKAEVELNNNNENGVNPISTFEGHFDKVEDVCWHPSSEDKFASVCDNGHLFIWDSRIEKFNVKMKAHANDANCVSWHPITHNLLMTGGSDQVVQLWDERRLDKELHSIMTDFPVYRVEWCPKNETVFAAAGLSSRIGLWDISKIGDDVLSAVEEENSCPEAILAHLGHGDAVSDISWCLEDAWTMASVSEDNVLNLWQVNHNILEDD